MKAYFLLAALPLCGAAAAPASAAIVTATFTGVIPTESLFNSGNSYDLTGVFGPASPNRGVLDGDAVKLVYTIDTSRGTGSFTSAGGQITGGIYSSAPSPILSAAVEINGVTRGIDTSEYSDVVLNSRADFSSLQFIAQDTGYGSADVNLTFYDGSIPGDLSTPFSLDVKDSTVYHYGGGEFNIGATSNEAGGSFDIDAVSFQVSSVPLPASLPMFGAAILGLGAIGFAMKKRKGNVVAP